MKNSQRLTGGLAQWRQLARRQFCGNLNVTTPQEVQCKPPLRQAAGTLPASGRQCVAEMTEFETENENKTNKWTRNKKTGENCEKRIRL